MTLAFGYVRTSTLDEVKQGSNERQKEEILRYAQSKGYDIEFLEDKAKSGKSTQRFEFEKMLKSPDMETEAHNSIKDRQVRPLVVRSSQNARVP